MRGLPGCGKSYTAKQLAGADGLVLETDAYFYTHVGDDPNIYDFQEHRLPEARDWIMGRFRDAISEGISPIVLDRGNGLNRATQAFARLAIDHGYEVELAEPTSEWWSEIRVLLKYPKYTQPILDQWAEKLSELTGEHHVPSSTIRKWMSGWRSDLTVQEIISYE